MNARIGMALKKNLPQRTYKNHKKQERVPKKSKVFLFRMPNNNKYQDQSNNFAKSAGPKY